jgi:hypothetical protein
MLRALQIAVHHDVGLRVGNLCVDAIRRLRALRMSCAFAVHSDVGLGAWSPSAWVLGNLRVDTTRRSAFCWACVPTAA